MIHSSSSLRWALLASALCIPTVVQADDAQEIAELRKSATKMQKMMEQMQQRIAQLESKQKQQTAELAQAKKSAPVVASLPPQPVLKSESPTLEKEPTLPPQLLGKKAPVTYRRTFNDHQVPMSRPLDYTLDPDYNGYFSVPNTPIVMKLNAKPRVDATYDNRNTGAPSRFIPAKFPLRGDSDFGGGGQFNMNANGTQLIADVRAPSEAGNFRFYYQNDFFGSDTGDMSYRLQHIYGQYYGLKVGYTTSAWENGDVWPDTVDYEGPNAVIFARRAVAQFTHALNDSWNATVGVEKPDFYVDADQKLASLPDFAFNTRWEDEKWGHIQISSILRDIGARDASGEDFHDFGWGLNAGFNLNLGESDSVQFLGVYGEGVGGMGNDTSFLNSDGGFSSNGNFEALPYWSLMGAWTHHWNDRFRSSLVYGHVNLDPASGMGPDFYATSNYGAANVIWQLGDRWSLGLEGLYGFKEAVSGRNSDNIFRFQMGMVYSLFD
ncbi:DcaP family trimeric outer membrane transporter [Rubritalea sp.]|uniref:DcaP family trimeric outer membrane transporter n=1 Tax=Rubritalea sp. TaxID=2109375 RepID=UPI003EF83374